MGYSKLSYKEYVQNYDYWVGEKFQRLPKFASDLDTLGYESVNAIDFYDDIFGDDLEEQREPEDYVTGEYGAIALELRPKEDGKKKCRRYTITRGNTKLYELIDNSENPCIMSACSYAGKTRHNANARNLYALVIEIDDIIDTDNGNGVAKGLLELIHSWKREKMSLPQPTYIVCSGSGLHLYFVFEKPIPLFKNVFEQLSLAKIQLTRRFWTSYVTNSYKNVQYEGLCQGFRIVGTKTKINSYAMAFRTGKKISIQELNEHLPEAYQVSTVYKSELPLKEAKRLYPDWYRRRIENGEGRGTFQRHPGIYHNWKDKILFGAMVGHRYNCLENLCALAVQCGIDPETLEKDCDEVMEYFEQLTVSEDNHFTIDDKLCAMQTYEDGGEGAYYRKIEYISNKTGIELFPNKRNGRKQAEHLKRISALRDIDYPNGSWREGSGRKPKEQVVRDWQREHPNGSKADCIRDTGLSKPTVYKWWETL